jgi:hypothetical protein
MVGGSLRVLHDIAEILLKVALKHQKSNQIKSTSWKAAEVVK